MILIMMMIIIVVGDLVQAVHMEQSDSSQVPENEVACEPFRKFPRHYRPMRNETPLRPPLFFFFAPSKDSRLRRLSSSTDTPLSCSQAAFSCKNKDNSLENIATLYTRIKLNTTEMIDKDRELIIRREAFLRFSL